MLESFFNKVAGLKVLSFIKKRHQHRCFVWILGNFKDNCFEEHLRMTVSAAAEYRKVLGTLTRNGLIKWPNHYTCEKCPCSEFLWSAFSRIRTEYGRIVRISPYLVRMRGNTDQKNSEYEHFSRSDRPSEMALFL